MVVLAKPDKAVAVAIGGDYIKLRVFDFIDKAIRLNEEQSIDIKDPEDATPFEDQIAQIAKTTESRLPVFVTCAAQGTSDEAILPFFKNPKYHGKRDYKNEKYHPARALAQKLAKAGMKPDKVHLDWGNDMQMNLRYVFMNYCSELKPGDLALHVIGGQGLNAGCAIVAKDCQMTEYQCNEPGHQPMPLIKENLLIEGEQRMQMEDPVTGIKGAAEPYIAGGNPDDPRTGPKATVYRFCKLATKNDPELHDALNALTHITGIELTKDSILHSPLFKLAQTKQLCSRDIGDASREKSDPLAQAIMIFNAGRTADFIIDTVQREGRASSEHPLKMVSFSGGFMGSLNSNCPAAWSRLESRLKQVFGEDLKLHFIKPEKGFDGTYEMAKMAIKPECLQQEPKLGFFARIWQSIKKIFGFNS